jgi:hypothetical protein
MFIGFGQHVPMHHDHDRNSGHLGQIAEILALGLMRLAARKSSRKPADFGESSLHLSLDQSGDAASFSTRTSP